MTDNAIEKTAENVAIDMTERALVCNGITFGYSPAQSLFDDFSLAVSPHERVYLSAPSGYGKTTLCLLMSNYVQPQKGEILIDGEPLSSKGVCPVQLIGQHPELMLDPRMRMSDSLHEAGECSEHLIHHLGIRDEWMSRYPHELSGGELQRFCIARALAAKPKYIIADEISTMLDALSQARVWHVLREEVDRHEIGLVFTSHSRTLAEKIATREIDLTSEF